MYRRSSLRSSLNTGYITGVDMCKVCTEAVHSVALWTRLTPTQRCGRVYRWVPKSMLCAQMIEICVRRWGAWHVSTHESILCAQMRPLPATPFPGRAFSLDPFCVCIEVAWRKLCDQWQNGGFGFRRRRYRIVGPTVPWCHFDAW